jgi:MoaA/NifB/PqqE/SkfB family radical SAM enzyme/predicted Zn-dependent protease
MAEAARVVEQHIREAKALLENKRFDQAIKEFERAINMGYEGKEVHKDLGFAYLAQREYDLAISQLQQALSFGRRDVHIYLALGRAYRGKGEYENSVKVFNLAFQAVPPQEATFYNNKILNEIEISQGKTVLESKPLGLWVTLTTRCNLRCVMCNIWKRPFDLHSKTIKEIINYFPYLEKLYWQGGEVFLSEYFEELLERTSDYPHIEQNINTNGILINEKWASKFSGKNISLTFAIDGITKETYEKIRRGARFEDLIRSIELVNIQKGRDRDSRNLDSSKGITTIMSFMVMKSNYRQLEGTLDFTKRYNFDYLQIYPIDGTIDQENIFVHKDREAIRYINEVKHRVEEKAREYGIRLLMRLPEDKAAAGDNHDKGGQQDNSCGQGPKRRLSAGDANVNACASSFSETRICPELRDGFCYLPWQHLFLDGTGEVRPSCYCQESVGDIKYSSLEEVWNGDKMRSYRQRILNRQYYGLCIVHFSREPELRFESINGHFARREYSTVLEELHDFLKLYPDHVGAWILLQRTYMLKKEHALAIEAAKEVIKRDPDNGEIYYDLAINCKILRKYGLAIYGFKKALDYGFNIPDVYFELGRTYRETHQHYLALQEFNRLIENGFDNPQIHFELGRTYRETHQHYLAIRELRKSIDSGFDTPEVRLELGMAYREAHQHDLALEQFERLLKDGFDKPRVRLELEKAVRESGRSDISFRELDSTKKTDPGDLNRSLELAQHYCDRNEFDLALKELNLIFGHHPEEKFIRLKMAQVYRKQRRYDLAAAELNSLIKEGFQSPQVRLELAIVYREARKYELSLTQLRGLIDGGSDGPEVRFELARVYRDAGMYGPSLSELKGLIDSGFDTPEVRLELARAYRETEQHDLALGELKGLIKNGFDRPQVHLELERIYRRRKEYDLALAELKKLAELDPRDGWLNVGLGKIYCFGKKEFDLAIKEFEAAARKGVENEELLIDLGRLYREEKRFDLSVRAFQKALQDSGRKSIAAFRNKILSEVELSQRKTILGSKPRILTVTLTTACNLRCVMCKLREWYREPWELPGRAAKDIIEKFPYLEYVTWSGGEVFLYRHFRELFEEALRYPDLRQEIVTSGLLIDRDWAERLVKSNLTLIYSIDAFTKGNYENIRRGAKFEDLINSLNILNECRGKSYVASSSKKGMTLVLNFVVMKSNLSEIEKAIDFAIKYRFDELRFAEVKFLQDQENIFLHRHQESLNYIRAVMGEIAQKAREHNIVLHNWFLNPDYHLDCTGDSHGANVERVTDKDLIPCYLPWRELYIEPGGWCKLQCFCNQKLGNICEESLDEIWNGVAMQGLRKKMLENDCLNSCSPQCLSGLIPRELLGSPFSCEL